MNLDEAAHPLRLFRYCPVCGSPRFERHDFKSKRCAQCGFTYYHNASAATVAVVIDATRRLLVARRALEPAAGTLDLPGGFIDITQSTKKICFIGTFLAGQMEYKTGDGKLTIVKDAEKKKFRKKVQQVTFSAQFARETGQEILYITERAVFRLEREGVTLIEKAPGVDVERDIIAKMDFIPRISPNLKLMDERIFTDKKMRISFIDE